MKPTTLLTFAAAVTGCAVAYGVHVFFKGDGGRAQASGADQSVSVATRSRSSFKPTGSPASDRRLRFESQAAAATANASATSQTHKMMGSQTATGSNLLPESQWRENAEKVESVANRELDRLVALLDLDPSQQNQIFSILARQSPHWAPGMQIANSASPAASTQTPTEDLSTYLTADQQHSLVEDEMDRQAWWSEVLPQLTAPGISDGDTVAAAGSETVVTAAPPPATKQFDGGGNLLEE